MSMTDREALRRFSASGLDCALIDSGIGFINGYVRLHETHVARNAGYDQINRTIHAHGGLTYGPDADGWVGFDTGHSGDYWPSSDSHLRFGSPEVTWDLNLLTREVESLASQLAEMTTIGDPTSSYDCTEDEFQSLLRDAKSWREREAAEVTR